MRKQSARRRSRSRLSPKRQKRNKVMTRKGRAVSSRTPKSNGHKSNGKTFGQMFDSGMQSMKKYATKIPEWWSGTTKKAKKLQDAASEAYRTGVAQGKKSLRIK